MYHWSAIWNHLHSDDNSVILRVLRYNQSFLTAKNINLHDLCTLPVTLAQFKPKTIIFDLLSNLGLSSHASATYSKSFDLCAPRRRHASRKNHVRLKVWLASAELFLISKNASYICVTHSRWRKHHTTKTQRSRVAYVNETAPTLRASASCNLHYD